MREDEILIALIGDVVLEIKESADECLTKARDDIAYGELLAYASALESIKRAFADKTYVAQMLDFDIDERYLGTR